MLYFIITTGRCNLKCRYCGGSFPPELVPWEIQYDIEELNSFISQDPDAIIAFYGGEPLLNAKFIEEVMDYVQAKRFVIQTNGLLFKKLKKNYWLRMDAVLLSIDGPEEITDYNRGKG
ncbi:MAG: radical SAM protein, partial [Thermoprotei archaeon]|nr:radical SAM protein [Thermoprotei archaeon]